jgi:hypothetical protein
MLHPTTLTEASACVSCFKLAAVAAAAEAALTKQPRKSHDVRGHKENTQSRTWSDYI